MNGSTLQVGLRIRFVSDPGRSLVCRIERLADGLIFDFDPAALNFGETPGQPFAPVTEESLGLYQKNLFSAPWGVFPDGNYCVTLHDTSAGNLAIGISEATMRGGDDSPSAVTNPAP
ncbi:MAG: hypothetical protein ABI353_04875 [Isosphaeraceae bacterium]